MSLYNRNSIGREGKTYVTQVYSQNPSIGSILGQNTPHHSTATLATVANGLDVEAVVGDGAPAIANGRAWVMMSTGG